ncbi:MAG: nucleotidyltransferase domain-containing protein [Candidatus Bathyarchaeia archaeon]|jgi:predicted nucleotidyltransferase
MSYDVVVKAALKRQEAFSNLSRNLEIIKRTVHGLDPDAETFLFGSAVEKEHNYSSDIDILIITNLHPARVLSELWKAGIKEPFEIHVHSREDAEFFKERRNF